MRCICFVVSQSVHSERGGNVDKVIPVLLYGFCHGRLTGRNKLGRNIELVFVSFVFL